MPRYYCDYCDAYLTHDSMAGRQQHMRGWKHRESFRNYYQQFYPQWAMENTGYLQAQGIMPMMPMPMQMPGMPGMPPPPFMGMHPQSADGQPMGLPPGMNPPPMFRPPPSFAPPPAVNPHVNNQN